ncbi:DUF5801 repeats-in-toxin domain-containing protein [Croceicoccus sediminis]|uniref:DUF5801 repeats-in-toxin domain-containing protein n=1 Tax=Croceicoccus sediminis TaxID=2571150 RepID=UPI0011831367|nr:DUF5801 repeats-in-toxin domain-containing protein [Croceicoccus sediminis]
MTISISFLDGDGVEDTLKLDQTSGVQDSDPDRPTGADDDDDDDDVPLYVLANADGGSDEGADDALVTGAGTLAEPFLDYLNTLNGSLLDDDLIAFAADVGGASSPTFATVTASGGETIKSVYFGDGSGNLFDGDKATWNGEDLLTAAGDNIYLWSVASEGGRILLATTSSVEGAGDLVAAFYMEPSYTGDVPPAEFTVKVEMITFMPINHPDFTDPDDFISFADVVNISVAGSLSFDFDNLDSGNFLWVAVGDGSEGLLVTGHDLNVHDGGSKDGQLVKGGQDPSDTVNTSQGGIGATIGINAQHFVDGPKDKGQPTDGSIGVFTLVTGFQPLEDSGTGQATGIDIDDVDYTGYINAPSAKIFISQTEGGTATFRLAAWEADADKSTATLDPETGKAYINTSGTGPYDEDAETALNDDTAIDLNRVVLYREGQDPLVWDIDEGSNDTTQGGIHVNITDNYLEISGVTTADTIEFFAEDGSTFNRFTVQGLKGTNAFDIGRVDISQGTVTSAAAPLLVDDDGPDAVASGTPDALYLDESETTDPDGGTGNAPADTVSATSATYAALFSGSDHGTDGAGTTSYTLDLSTDGTGSGIFVIDTSGGKGEEVKLYQQDDQTIIGYTGDSPGGEGSPVYQTIFVISVENNSADAEFGEVTFALGADYANVWHSDFADGDADDDVSLTVGTGEHLRLVQMLVDGDFDPDSDPVPEGDSDSAYVDLGAGVFYVEDDGPKAGTPGTPTKLYVDESVGTDPDGGAGMADADVVTASADFGALFTGGTYGTDLPGSTGYTLVLATEGDGSGLYAIDPVSGGKGDEILLYTSGGQIIGTAYGDTYLSIAVDNDDTSANFGKVTFSIDHADYGNIWHSGTGSDDDAAELKLDAAGDLLLRQTLTDADGDKDTADMGLGIGVFYVEDDGPKAGTPGTPTKLYVDESVGTDPDGGAGMADADVVTASADFGALFTGGAYGTDLPGSTGYTLVLATEGDGSGLYAIDPVSGGKGDEILLYTSGGQIIGTAYGDTYLSIAVNNDDTSGDFGKVTFSIDHADYGNIWHSGTGSDDDAAELKLDAAGDLVLRQTLTDADGDKDTADMGLGIGVFYVEDDGPKAGTPGTPTKLYVDESVGTDPDGGAGMADADVVTASADFGALFTGGAYGTDLPGSTGYTLVLATEGDGSGLYAIDPVSGGKGDEILLYTSGSQIIGTAYGDTYLSIAVDNDDTSANFGKVTFSIDHADYGNIWHSGTGSDDDAAELKLDAAGDLVLRQTLTDADGDKDTADMGLGIGVFYVEDDGPKAGTAQTPTKLYLDESVGTDPGGPGNAAAGTTTATANLGALFINQALGTDLPGTTGYSLVLSLDGVGSGLFTLGADGAKGEEVKLYQQDSGTVIGYTGDDPGGEGTPDYDEIIVISVETAAGPDFGKVTFQFGADYDDLWHPDETLDDESIVLTVAGSETLALRQTVTDADGDSAYADMQLGANVFYVEDDGPWVTTSEIDSYSSDTTYFADNVVGDTLSDADGFSFGGVQDEDYSWLITDAPGGKDSADASGFSWRYADVDGDGVVGEHEIIGSYKGVDLYELSIADDGAGTANYYFEMLSAFLGSSTELDTSNIKAGGPDTNFIDVGVLNGGDGDFVRISGFDDANDDGVGDPDEGEAVNESNLNVGVDNGNLDSGEILAFSLYENGPDADPTPITGIIIGTKTAQGFSYEWVAYDAQGNVVDTGGDTIGKNEAIVVETNANNPFAYVEIKNLDGEAVKIGLGDIEILRNPPDYVLEFDAALRDADMDASAFSFEIGIDGDGDSQITTPIDVSFAPDATELAAMQLAPIA